MNEIYLDHAATTPLIPKALEVLRESLEKDYANPSSSHKLGIELSKRIDLVRKNILNLIGASEKDYHLIFTSSATEANNMLIKGIGKIGKIVYSKADHASVTVPASKLRCYNDNPKELHILTTVNHQSGTVLKIDKCSRENVITHIDASQSFGKYPLNLNDLNVSSVTISAHKMGGPKGVGALIIKKNISLSSLLDGGEQEYGFRSSTVNAPLIFSWQAAVECLKQNRETYLEKTYQLNRLVREKLGIIEGLYFPFEIKNTSPYILAIILKGVSSDIFMRHLSEEGIFVSTTSACSSKKTKGNRVLDALNIPLQDQKGILRISFGYFTNINEIDLFCEKFIKLYKELEFLISVN